MGAALLLIVAAVAPMRASAQDSGPYAWLLVNDQRFEIPVVMGDDKKSYVIGEGGEGWSGGVDGEWSCTIGGTLNPDPSIAYGIAVVDFGAPTLFGFMFFTPIVPTGAPNVVTGSIVGGLTDATGDGIAITPIGPTLQAAYVTAPMTSLGVDVGPGFAAGPGPPGSFYAYGPHVAGPIPGPGPGPWTGLGVDLFFGLSGGGDIAALTGFASINVVPEPATLSLLGLGLGAIGALAVRRRR